MPICETDDLRASLPDCAAEADARGVAIDQVGIRGLRYPIVVWDKQRRSQPTVAELALSVGLPADEKGTHMSRFVEVLEHHRGELTLGTVPELLAEIQRRLEAHDAHLEARFPYFLERHAPVSGVASLMEYRCAFVASRSGDQLDFVLEVEVPVTTLCPCSKAISRYGAHNQRGLVRARLGLSEMVWIEDVVALIEEQASSPLYALLKREDEKYVTERAYERPRFVEDLVRDTALALRAVPGVASAEVEVENLESIHNHSAWAVVRWGSGQAASAPAPAREAVPFGTWLRSERESRGLTQRELAGAANISPSVLSRVEHGEKGLGADALERLARALAHDPEKLALRAGVVSPALLARISADPEGFLAWSRR